MHEAIRQKLELLFPAIPREVLAFFRNGNKPLDQLRLLQQVQKAEQDLAYHLLRAEQARARVRAGNDLIGLSAAIASARCPSSELAAAFGVDDPLELLPEKVRGEVPEMETMRRRAEPVQPMPDEPDRYRAMPVDDLLRLVYLGGVPVEVTAVFQNGNPDVMRVGLDLLQQRQRGGGQDPALKELVSRAQQRVTERANMTGPPKPQGRVFRV
jgi:hypothetical protein